MEAAVEKILREFEERSEKESSQISAAMESGNMLHRRDEFLLSVGPATGMLINLLTKEMKARIILEIGSSYGYSTVWLAEAARATGGKVISLELHEEKQKHARASIEKAGLGGFVDFRLGDARESLARVDPGIDFVLLDLWKDLYVPCLELFYPKLNPGALIAADNMIFPEGSRPRAAEYQKAVRGKPDIQSVLLPVGSGIELSRYTRGVEIL
jgi:predicted O-methyltransferase YrrM